MFMSKSKAQRIYFSTEYCGFCEWNEVQVIGLALVNLSTYVSDKSSLNKTHNFTSDFTNVVITFSILDYILLKIMIEHDIFLLNMILIGSSTVEKY